ncbi:MAG: hypothetical protein HOP23_01310 [Methylococcaceae bacterium]|nr:hypothetical protein [Methylococcaceae bacterium]
MTTSKTKSKKLAPVAPVIESVAESDPVTKNSKKSSDPKLGTKSTEAFEAQVAAEVLKQEDSVAVKKNKPEKAKVIRDSFSFPEQDYLLISELKKACLAEGIHVKKSELLRAGLHLLTKLKFTELKEAVEQIEKVQTGRPNKGR